MIPSPASGLLQESTAVGLAFRRPTSDSQSADIGMLGEAPALGFSSMAREPRAWQLQTLAPVSELTCRGQAGAGSFEAFEIYNTIQLDTAVRIGVVSDASTRNRSK